MPAWQTRGVYYCNSGITVIRVADFFLKLDLRPAPQERIHVLGIIYVIKTLGVTDPRGNLL